MYRQRSFSFIITGVSNGWKRKSNCFRRGSTWEGQKKDNKKGRESSHLHLLVVGT
jgi:hypothetical protein